MPAWVREFFCAVFGGHRFDVRAQRRTARFSRDQGDGDPGKTRCTRCGAAFYVLYQCSCGAYGCGHMAV
jgi:hypothetical protein